MGTLTRKLAHIILGRLCIHPMIFACRCAASTIGNPVIPSFHACSLFSSVSHCKASNHWPKSGYSGCRCTHLYIRELFQERSTHADTRRERQNMVIEVPAGGKSCSVRIGEILEDEED